MKLKNILLLAGILLPASSVFAQYTEDVLRFSQTEQGLTARFRALGGAQTALGGDASALASNPAGLGLFTRSELSFTPELSNSNIKSNYLGMQSSVQKDRAGINQFALVFHSPSRRYNSSDATAGWVSFNFGIAYNKTNNFNATTSSEGVNTRSSYGDYLADLARNPDDQLATAGYESYLIELDSLTDTYYPITNINNRQANTIYRMGNQSEVNFSVGANYSNSLFLGASVGLASLNFDADRRFIENGQTLDQAGVDAAGLAIYDVTKQYLDANYALTYRSNQQTRGTGANVKLGLIYRANPNIRVGMSFISPTWYSISDTFSEGLNARFNKANGQNETINNNDELYELTYTLRTPYRLNGGVAFIINKIGLISGDVEYVDYASMHFSSIDDRTTENNTNSDIRDLYKSAVNFKVGGELKLNPVALRLGYNTTGNPYQNASLTSSTVSAGVGYRVNNISFDLTYANTSSDYSTSPYTISEDYRFFGSTGRGENAAITDRRNNFFATVSLRF